MNKVVYSQLVKRKMVALKNYLTEMYDLKTAIEVIKGITIDVDRLEQFEESGTNISEMYDIDTDYWYVFSHQHYIIYRIVPGTVIVVQMFHEKEDFMMKLFGESGRTQESIDYWGE